MDRLSGPEGALFSQEGEKRAPKKERCWRREVREFTVVFVRLYHLLNKETKQRCELISEI